MTAPGPKAERCHETTPADPSARLPRPDPLTRRMEVSSSKTTGISRRSLMRRTAAVTAFGPLFQATRGELSAQARQNGPNRNSPPSDLKITDIRGCTIASNYDYPI